LGRERWGGLLLARLDLLNVPLQVKEVLDLSHRMGVAMNGTAPVWTIAWQTNDGQSTPTAAGSSALERTGAVREGMGGQGRGSRCAWQMAPRPRTCCCICTCLLDSCAGHNGSQRCDGCLRAHAPYPQHQRSIDSQGMWRWRQWRLKSAFLCVCGFNIFRVIPVSSDACTAGWCVREPALGSPARSSTRTIEGSSCHTCHTHHSRNSPSQQTYRFVQKLAGASGGRLNADVVDASDERLRQLE
jgi:hypothetical protein